MEIILCNISEVLTFQMNLLIAKRKETTSQADLLFTNCKFVDVLNVAYLPNRKFEPKKWRAFQKVTNFVIENFSF